MKVKHYPCGPAANQSEVKAFDKLKTGIISLPGDETWILLTNLTFSVTHERQSDEIDIVAIGPPGIRIIEVKHWTDSHRIRDRDQTVHAADLVTRKARKVATTLRKTVPHLPRVDGTILITQQPSKARRLLAQRKVRGVHLCSLKDWREAVGADVKPSLSPSQVEKLASKLAPKRMATLNDPLRRFGSYINLELQDDSDEAFHRIFRGIHSVSRDRVILHIYDYSAGTGTEAERKKARAEHDILHSLQRHAWAPRILDSFQDAPRYQGEMSFFTIIDPAVPSIARRTKDKSWTISARLVFARKAVMALQELHEAVKTGQPMVHGNLSPDSILVMHDNSPVLTGFGYARPPGGTTHADRVGAQSGWPEVVPPEVQDGTLGGPGLQQDIYSLCASLQMIFRDHSDDGQVNMAQEIFATGMREPPAARASLEELDRQLRKLLGGSSPTPAAPPARFWTEGQEVRFRGRGYRIVSCLGSGGAGTAFKVVELDSSTKEEIGTFVGKVAHDKTHGDRICRRYQLARDPVSRHTAFSRVFEIATEWRNNEFMALLTWIEGVPLADFTGLLPLLAEQNQLDAQELALRWLRSICEALDTLHRNGLVHGDVSPHNLIVSGEDLVLTDYDSVTRFDEPKSHTDTDLYSSHSNQQEDKAGPGDDLHALAASFFHVLFDKEPFPRNGNRCPGGSLDWEKAERKEYPGLVPFLEQATDPDSQKRLSSVAEALKALSGPTSTDFEEAEVQPPDFIDQPPTDLPERHPNEVPWLRNLLASYPGSRWGNQETRGLDSKFAAKTYVPTELEETLFYDILARRVRLVILCGNAGDGKTALLQYLAKEIGMDQFDSSERIVDEKIEDGPRVRMNLDGSAAYQGRSADEILDEFLEPFQDGKPCQDITHLLAINDGRLLEWIENPPNSELKTILKGRLQATLRLELDGQSDQQEGFIAFHHLNRRSHVGRVDTKQNRITTDFLDKLLDQLYGGSDAGEKWQPCATCSAQESCEVFRASKLFGPGDLPGAEREPVRNRARERLFEALQAVHFRGETHITVRELRSALVYILFGTRYCTDYHKGLDSTELSYWDRAFDPESPRRQGEVLRELVHLDPALEAHPKIDRRLLRTTPSHPNEGVKVRIASARRRAYFEWTKECIAKVVGDEDTQSALGLAHGRYLRRFRDISLLNKTERQELCEDLCKGIAHIGELPHLALNRPGIVPLRITPRTPTETMFWSEKPLSRFEFIPEIWSDNGTDVDLTTKDTSELLPREAYLSYSYKDGRKERLRLSAGLFHRLLRLKEGYQLADVSTDETFANLSVFLRRLAQENDRKIMAWNPMRDDTIFRVSTEVENDPDGPKQKLVIHSDSGGESS